jgi:hypothetical protein
MSKTLLPLSSWELFQAIPTFTSQTTSVLGALLGDAETKAGHVCQFLRFVSESGLDSGRSTIWILWILCWFLVHNLKTSCAQIRWVVEKVPGKTKQWKLLGRHAAPKCLAALCGINSRRLMRASVGSVDHRFACNGAVSKLHWNKRNSWWITCSYLFVRLHKGTFWSEVGTKMPVKRRDVDIFLLGLYQNAAGMLPNKLLDFCFYWLSSSKYSIIQDSRPLMITWGSNVAVEREGIKRSWLPHWECEVGRGYGWGWNEWR